MATISPTSINDGDAVTAASVNSQINTIVNDYNGNITAANLAANAVTTAKLTDSNVTAAKLATNAINLGNIRTSASDQTGISTEVMVNLATGTSLSVTIPSGGRDVKIEGWIQTIQRTGTGEPLLRLRDGGAAGAAATTASTTIGEARGPSLGVNSRAPFYVWGVLTAPAAGTRQFGMSFLTSANTIDIHNATELQGYLLVTVI